MLGKCGRKPSLSRAVIVRSPNWLHRMPEIQYRPPQRPESREHGAQAVRAGGFHQHNPVGFIGRGVGGSSRNIGMADI